VIRELATGEKHAVKPTKGAPDESGPVNPVISPDGKTIAYGTERRKAYLRRIGTDGSGQRDLCSGVGPVQWFPDGGRILGIQWPTQWPAKDSMTSIVSVSVSDGSVHKIKTASAGPESRAGLSPDAKYVAYGLPFVPGKQDIFVVEMASGQETPLVQHPADDRLLGWTPDGRHLLFASDRTGSWDAWLLPVAEGKAQGVPELVARNIGAVEPKGFTPGGSYYYEVAYNADNTHTAAIDVAAGQLLSAPVALPAAGHNGYADWSPDGQSLAYCSYPEPSRQPHVIRIRSLATGQERELLPELPMVRCLCWSPDGRSVLASWLTVFGAGQEEWPGRVCRVDVDTGESTVVLQNESKSGGVWRAELSPDQKTLYYSQGFAVFRRQIDGGEQKSLFEFPKKAREGRWITWALSPTGESLAITFNEPTKNEKEWVTKIVVVPSGGGETTELLRREEAGGELSQVAWSRDSTTLLFTIQRDFDTIEFWQVPAAGGQSRKITEAKLGWCYSLRVHPDGQRIAFMAGKRYHELWVMENFLPAAKAADTSTSVTTLQPAVVSGSPASQVKAPVSMRLIQEEVWGDVSMSPDRRYLCHTGWEQGEIFIRELATGEQRTIKPTKRVPEESKPSSPILSPDNKTIAYHVGFQERSDVCLIGADGSGQRVLYPGIIRSALEPAGSGPALPYPGNVRPVQWFPDGSRFLAMRWPDVMHFFNDIEIVSVSLADGSTEIIKKLTGEFYGTTIRLSPDAKAVAYELASKDTPKKRDIFAIDIDSKQETPLVVHAANDRLLDWTPDGRHILFVSDRMGPWSIWLVPVTMGQGQGVPELVGRSTGPIGPVGFAEDGSYCYRIAYRDTDIHTAVVDLATSQLLSAPARLGVTGSDVADWSPDGKYLAYCAPSAASSEQRVIRIRSLDTGQEREIPDKVTGFNYLRWSPDGRSLLASGLVAYKPEDVLLPSRVYRIDAVIGDSMILLDTKEHEVRMAELSPDGKILYYTTNTIIRREIDSGQERILFTYSPKAPWAGSALSPNGEFIAVASNEGTKEKAEGGVKKILLIPSQGGQATELLRWDQEAASFLTQTGWSGDGKTVLFTLHREPVAGKNPKEVNEFWQVSIEGGEPRKIFETDLHIQHSRCFRVHPDGQRIAFSVTTAHGELWAMENFLPASAALPQTK